MGCGPWALPLRLWPLVLLVHGALLRGVIASRGFIVVTAPRNSKVSWLKIPEDGSFGDARPQTLVDEGLRHPQGVAVDQRRKRLYVADPDAQRIYSYALSISDDSLWTDGKPTIVSQNIESRWVAVDGTGNVFFSDEPQNLILKVPAERVLRGEVTPEVVYSGGSVTEVNQPGGVAVDNFHVFWTNKHFGMQVGSVVRGAEAPDTASVVSVLARNTVKSYGVCLALGNVYFTDAEKRLYGVKKTGGPVAEVSAQLNHPRGCAWDGDGTVYVADRGENAVYSFAGNMHTIGSTQVKKAFSMEDPFGVAVVYSAASSRWRPGVLCGLPAALAVAAAALAATVAS